MRTLLRDNEKVILEVTKHWIVLVKPVFIMASSVVIYIFLAVSHIQFIKSSSWLAFLALCLSGVYLWYSIRERKVNLWIITNLRVISEEGLFTWQAKESPIDKINNMQYRQTILGRMYDFGDVEIQTAAEAGATIDQYVSHPKLLHDTVVEMQEGLSRNPPRSQVSGRNIRDIDDERLCPFCAEIIKKSAFICKHCHQPVNPEEKTVVAAKGEGELPRTPRTVDIEGPIDAMPGGRS